MRWSAASIICLIFVSTCVQGQRTSYGLVKGVVIDSLDLRPLESASIRIYLISDSSLVNYALSNQKGEYIISDIPLNTVCTVIVTNRGYESFSTSFILSSNNKEKQLDTIRLAKLYKELKSVTITASRQSVVVKKDTLEFNVSSFKTMPNAMLEDLLKQLPGAEVDKDGNITINGKKVTKITLDGREFFGGDPKIAIKSLPKDIIDKLQVTDNKSLEARFNKITDGNQDLAINITLRKEVQKGWFGRVSAGYGSNERYEGNAMLNFFSGSKQLNFIGSTNNTNRGGISGSDFNVTNASGTLSSNGDGLTRSTSAGANFSDNLSKQIKLNGSYFYDNSHSDNFMRIQRINNLPDTSFYYNGENSSGNDYVNHRFSLNAQYTIDTVTELYLNSYVNTNMSDGVNLNKAASNSLAGQPLNTSENTFNSKSNSNYTASEFFFSHRFTKLGGGVTLNFNYNYNKAFSINANIGKNDYYKNYTLDTTEQLNQRSVGESSGRVLSIAATYTAPFSKYFTAIIKYNYSRNASISDKITNRFNSATDKYDIEDSAYSNAFSNVTEAHKPGASLIFDKNKFQASLYSGLQFLERDDVMASTGILLHQHYVNFVPSASMRYNFSKTGSVSIFYNGRSQQPSIQQLQPVADNNNPLYLLLGNPDLHPSFFHNISMQVRESKGSSYWVGVLNFNLIRNDIVNETWFDDMGKQLSQPINVNGNYGTFGNLQYSRTAWKNEQATLRINLGANGYFNRNNSFANKAKVISNAYILSQSAGLNFTYKELLSLMPSFTIRYDKTHYLSETMHDVHFNTKTFSMSAFLNYPKWLIVENNLQYNYKSEIATGFSKNVTMWSAALNCLLFKKQQGMLRLAFYDILKQNAGVYRSITPNYIEDRQTQVLQRYFLLSFIYNLKKSKLE